MNGPIDENVVKDARCLGTNPTYPYVTQSSKYTSDLLKNTNFNGKLLSGNNTALKDYMQLLGLDLITLYNVSSGYKRTYWYASQCTFIDNEGTIHFALNDSEDVNSIGLSRITILEIRKENNYQEILYDTYTKNMPAYPVIILQDGILDKVTKVEKDGVVAYNLLELYE